MTKKTNKKTEGIINEKPTLETETIRGWVVDKEKQKEIEKNINEEDTVDLGNDMKVALIGFHIARNKETKEIGFAYKIRHDKNMLLFYASKKFRESKNFKEIMNVIDEMCMFLNFEKQDLEEFIKSNAHNIKALKKISDGKVKPNWDSEEEK